MRRADADFPEIACRQVLRKETSVFSSQWTVLPSAYDAQATPSFLLDRYLDHIRRFTLSLVRPRRDAAGVEFRCLGFPLLRFRPPAENENAVTLAICGGLLVQRQNCAKGEVTFSCETVPGGTRVSLHLADYCPLLLGGPAPSRWRRWLFRLTQAALHRLVATRFLVRLHRDLAGRRICYRLVRLQGSGEESI